MATFLHSVAQRETSATCRALSFTAAITLVDNDPLDVVELVERLNGAKMNSAGSTVAISLAVHERGLMFADVVW
nr:hypothetical protein [Mycobacterium leprae]